MYVFSYVCIYVYICICMYECMYECYGKISCIFFTSFVRTVNKKGMCRYETKIKRFYIALFYILKVYFLYTVDNNKKEKFSRFNGNTRCRFLIFCGNPKKKISVCGVMQQK